MSATIKDVADYAQVAVSTVSRVINNKDRVSQETRDKVYEAIEALGVPPAVRGEALTLEQFARLSDLFCGIPGQKGTSPC